MQQHHPVVIFGALVTKTLEMSRLLLYHIEKQMYPFLVLKKWACRDGVNNCAEYGCKHSVWQKSKRVLQWSEIEMVLNWFLIYIYVAYVCSLFMHI